MDVLEALAASCTQLAAAWTPRAAFNLTCDVVVASLLLVLHGATLMSQVGAGGFEKVPVCPPNFRQPTRQLWPIRLQLLPKASELSCI